MDLCTFYQLWPGKDCGICGCSSCNTFARRVLFRGEHPGKCVWLDEENLNYIRESLNTVNPVLTRVRKRAVFEPCITDSDMVMAEMYLAPRNVEFGYLDPGFCDILPLYFEAVKSSQKLGIARVEHEGKEVLISQTGKVVVRQAEDEEDALRTCELVSRLVSGSVICTCLCTGIECVSGLCSCTECEVLGRIHSSRWHKEMGPYIEPCESAVVKGLSLTWKGEFTRIDLDVASLRAEAVALLSKTPAGLIDYSLIHHFSKMVEALGEAALPPTECDKQRIDRFVRQAVAGSYSVEEYHEIDASLRKHTDHRFFRELYKVIFHSKCIAEIKSLVEHL